MTVSQIDSFVSALKLFKEPVFHPAKASVYEELGIWAQKYDRKDLALACAQAASDVHWSLSTDRAALRKRLAYRKTCAEQSFQRRRSVLL